MQVDVREYDMQGGGIRLNPVALQIVDLVEYVAEETEETGNPFDAVDGGFVVDTFQDTTVVESESAADEDDMDFLGDDF